MPGMRRRDFITLLGGAAAAWPLAARARQPDRVRLIGVLAGGGAADDPDAQGYIGAFLQGLDDPLAAGGGHGTFATGINDAGQIVGFYQDGLSRTHGFLLSGGTYAPIDHPTALNLIG
jgi:probable HAF family extracellular repeat protein